MLLRTATSIVRRSRRPTATPFVVAIGNSHLHQQQPSSNHPRKSPLQLATASRRSLHLTPRESDHLLLHNAGRLAQYRLARGLQLNVPEARALIAMQMMEMIRNGKAATIASTTGSTVQREGTVSDLMAVGTQLLGRNQVLPGVASLVREVQIEATFPDGTKLLTIHDPISKMDGDLELALEGSFLPVPDVSVFHIASKEVEGGVEEGERVPGQVMVSTTLPSIEINSSSGGATSTSGPHLIELAVTNTGDRPIQVGSHYRESIFCMYLHVM
jgi:urease